MLCPASPRWYGRDLEPPAGFLKIIAGSERRAEVPDPGLRVALPDGYTAIPADADPAMMKSLGLVVRQISRTGESLPPGALGTFPLPGTVVGTHSVVSVVTGPPAPTTYGCEGLRIDIATLHHAIPIDADRSSYQIVVHPHEILRLEAVGPCADSVHFASGDRRVLSPRFVHELFAVRPGTTDVGIWMPTCAGSEAEACRGGLDQLATVQVHVLP